MTSRRLFLVADVGGTNTRLGLADDNGLIEGSTQRYKNAVSESFQSVVEAYLEQTKPGPLAGACAGVAGLVADGVAHMTNLDWKIDREVIGDVTGAPAVDVINDLQAQGFALDDLPPQSLKQLAPSGINRSGPRLVIGLGTGFNIVPVHKDLNRLIVPSCEAGHMNAPFQQDLSDLYSKIQSKCGGVRIEWLLAGQGLQNIHEAHTGQRLPAGEIMELVAQDDDKARQTLRDYMTILGTVTADLAISHLPYGGIFFTGGVSRAVTPYFEEYEFASKMSVKEDFKDLLSSFPITLIDDDFAALKGCARYLTQISG